ncbi:MAG: RnfABCDGE type electron transport complex subunit D [Myxococcota bacterium]
MRWDPRYNQIFTLGALLVYGLVALDFEVQWPNVVAVLLSTQLTQWLGDRRIGRRYDPRSAAISSLSLCLLLRTNSVWVAAFAGMVAIGAKFVVRVRGKHLFNPAMVGIVAAVLLTDAAWISPGQWGNAALAALFFASAGTTVVQRAERSDVTYAFLGFYALLLFYRSWAVFEPVTIPVHRLQSGALLLFAFFMISDPKTTPDTRAGRILYAGIVALGAYFVHFVLFRSNGLVWSLFCCSPLVPLIDRLIPGDKYQWSGAHRPAPQLASA